MNHYKRTFFLLLLKLKSSWDEHCDKDKVSRPEYFIAFLPRALFADYKRASRKESHRATMERLRLWRYKKLTNENVKDEAVIEKHSDDEDNNSCFKLKRNLKVRVGGKSSPIFNLLTLFTTMQLMSSRVKLSSLSLQLRSERINY